MNYYPHHIGDFRSGSIHMTRIERWIYRDMIEVYYDTEKPLPLNVNELCHIIGARSEEDRKVVAELLQYKFEKTEDGFRKARCDDEIAAYRAKAETAKSNGRMGGRPAKAKANPEKPNGFRSSSNPVAAGNPGQAGSQTNQEPITKNQEPIQKQLRVQCLRHRSICLGVSRHNLQPTSKNFVQRRTHQSRQLQSKA